MKKKCDCDIDEKLLLCKTEVEEKIVLIEKDIKILKEIQTDVKEMLDIFRSSKGAIKVIGWIGKGIRWTALTAAAIGALWAVFHEK